MLANISRSKGNQIIKCGQSIEYIIENNFLEKSYIKYRGEACPRLFYKKEKLSISLD